MHLMNIAKHRYKQFLSRENDWNQLHYVMNSFLFLKNISSEDNWYNYFQRFKKTFIYYPPFLDIFICLI
jgi:hypothetical protein